MTKIPRTGEHERSHPHVPLPFDDLNDKIADKISSAFGSMGMFWTLVTWQTGWMVLATLGAPLLKGDPYPFVFLLFLGNLVQLWSLPILGTTQNRADEKRNAKADADHMTFVYLAKRADENNALLREMLTGHAAAQDMISEGGPV